MSKLLGFLALLLPALALAASTATATLTWLAPTGNTDGSPITGTITYNVYQGLSGALAKVQSGVTTTTLVVTAGLTPGTTQCFALTAVVAGQESAQSTPACVPINSPTPNAPTQVIIVLSGVP